MRKILVLFAVFALGCGEAAPQRENAALQVTDDAGRQVVLPSPAQRVVSLLPTVTDLLIAMHAHDRLIARTDYDIDPRIADLPSLGGGLTPSVEWLAARKPDLVISWPDRGTRSLVERLTSVGVPVYVARTESVSDSYRILEDLGVLLGMQRSADSVSNALRASLDAIRARTQQKKPVTVAYVVGIDPPMVAASGTFIDELIGIAGGRSVFAELKLWPQINLEELLRRDPDVIVLADTNLEDPVRLLRRLPGWRELRAVKSGRVHRVSPYFFNRSGPTMPRAAAELARFFHE